MLSAWWRLNMVAKGVEGATKQHFQSVKTDVAQRRIR